MNSLPNRPIPCGVPGSAKTQRAPILRLLIDARGAWVPAPKIAACAMQYNARLYELRRLSFCIENRLEANEQSAVRQSWFRLVKEPSVATAKPSPEPDEPSRFKKKHREDYEHAAPLFASAGVR